MIKKELHITEAELEIMSVLWQKKQASVKEVHEELSKEKEAGYTTTLKQMQVMHEKGLLKRDESKRQHIYFPAIEQQQVQKRFMDKIMDNLFQGSVGSFIMQALGSYKTTPEELDEIKSMIDKVKKNKK